MMSTTSDNYLRQRACINENYARELMGSCTPWAWTAATHRSTGAWQKWHAFTAGASTQRAGAFVYRAASHDQAAQDASSASACPRARARRTARISSTSSPAIPRPPASSPPSSCRRLVSDTPCRSGRDAWRGRLHDQQRRSSREVLRAIIGTADFWSEAFGSGKIKTPHEFVVSALRALGAEVTSARAFVEGPVSSPTSDGHADLRSARPHGVERSRHRLAAPIPARTSPRMNFVLSLVSQTTQGVAASTCER